MGSAQGAAAQAVDQERAGPRRTRRGRRAHATARCCGTPIVAVITFSLCASGGYLINDAADVESDRRHPKKRYRPIAAGIVPVMFARVLGIVLVAASITAGGLLASWKLAVVLGGYVILTFSYSTWLKHVPVLEMMLVAAGFLLRPDRRRGGDRRQGVPVVPDRRVVRLALHGGRQAHRRGHRVR